MQIDLQEAPGAPPSDEDESGVLILDSQGVIQRANETAHKLLGAGEGTLVGRNLVAEIRRLETIRRDFVANVSHELRTPLASIRAMAETLQDGALHDPDVSHRFLETIVAESDRLTRIAQDLLILSAAESGKPDEVPIDLSALLVEA